MNLNEPLSRFIFNGSSILYVRDVGSLPATSTYRFFSLLRVLAQLVARDVRDVEVAGSNPVYPILHLSYWGLIAAHSGIDSPLSAFFAALHKFSRKVFVFLCNFMESFIIFLRGEEEKLENYINFNIKTIQFYVILTSDLQNKL